MEQILQANGLPKETHNYNDAFKKYECWTSRDKLISNVLLCTLHMDMLVLVDRLELTAALCGHWM